MGLVRFADSVRHALVDEPNVGWNICGRMEGLATAAKCASVHRRARQGPTQSQALELTRPRAGVVGAVADVARAGQAHVLGMTTEVLVRLEVSDIGTDMFLVTIGMCSRKNR